MEADVDPLRAAAARVAGLFRHNPELWSSGVRRWATDPPFHGDNGILPIPLPTKVTTDERIALLAAIHDASVVPVAQINPWRDPDELPEIESDSFVTIPGEYRLAIRYDILVHHRIPELREHWETHEGAIDLFIAEFAAANTALPADRVASEGPEPHRELLLSRDNQTIEPAPAPNPEQQCESTTLRKLLVVFTNGLSEERIRKAAFALDDNKLTANDKLTTIHSLLPFPATASTAQLGEMLGVTKQAVHNTKWWTDNRKGQKSEEINRRQALHRQRAESFEPDRDDESEGA